MYPRNQLVLMVFVLALLTSCVNSAESQPQHKGIFLSDKGILTELDLYPAAPDKTPKLLVKGTPVKFTLDLDNFISGILRLISYDGRQEIKNVVPFTMTKSQTGVYEITVSEFPVPDIYCFVQVNQLAIPLRIQHWCFQYGDTSSAVISTVIRTVTMSGSTKSTEAIPTFTPRPSGIIPIVPITLNNVLKVKYLQISYYVQGNMIDIKYSSDGKTLAIVSDLRIHLYSTKTFNEICSINPESQITSFDFSPDGLLFAVGLIDKTVRIWKSDCSLLKSLAGHSKWVLDVSFSPDGQFLVSGSEDKTVRLWRVSDWTLMFTLSGHTSDVHFASFSTDGNLIVSVNDELIRIWGSGNGKLLHTLKGHKYGITDLAFSPDGKLLSSASLDESVQIWRLEDGALVKTLPGNKQNQNKVEFSPDGKLFALESEREKIIRIWRVDGWELLYTIKDAIGLAFSPDGQIFATGSTDNLINLWRTEDGKLMVKLTGKPGDRTVETFSPDGKVLVSRSRGEVYLWGVIE